jgi:hypothetical protein
MCEVEMSQTNREVLFILFLKMSKEVCIHNGSATTDRQFNLVGSPKPDSGFEFSSSTCYLGKSHTSSCCIFFSRDQLQYLPNRVAVCIQ